MLEIDRTEVQRKKVDFSCHRHLGSLVNNYFNPTCCHDAPTHIAIVDSLY